MQCITVLCSVCSTVLCSVCSTVLCNALHYCAVQYSTVQYTAISQTVKERERGRSVEGGATPFYSSHCGAGSTVVVQKQVQGSRIPPCILVQCTVYYNEKYDLFIMKTSFKCLQCDIFAVCCVQCAVYYTMVVTVQ